MSEKVECGSGLYGVQAKVIKTGVTFIFWSETKNESMQDLSAIRSNGIYKNVTLVQKKV